VQTLQPRLLEKEDKENDIFRTTLQYIKEIASRIPDKHLSDLIYRFMFA